MDALGINLGYLIMQILGIAVLLLLLRGYAYEPILNILEERKAKIAKGLEDARAAAIARDNADAEAKKIVDAARADAAKVRADAATQAEKTRTEIVAQANKEAKAKIADAVTAAEAERTNVLAELRGQVAAISVAAANKLVGEALDENRQHKLLGDFFARVPDSVSNLSGSTAVVTSALPLTDAEKKSVSGAVKAASIEYKVDPRILGGLIVRVDDQVVDNSVASQIGALGNTLK